MDKNKLIEEMANIIALKAFERAHEINGDENLADIVATELYDNGYRRASEVAKEIFADIRANCVDSDGYFLRGAFMNLQLDTMKKYTEGEG